jgi:preprotein translocase subunit SecA
MLANIMKLFFGSRHEREIKKIEPLVAEINEIAKGLESMPEEEFLKQTAKFKEKLANGATVEDILPEAYATVKDAARRLIGTKINLLGNEITWDMVHYDVQLIGGILLARNSIAEMATGEGKTLVSTLPVYLHALTGRGVHLVTVNDYLAERDSIWMGHLFKYLGLTVGCILGNMPPNKRREKYNCDITYGTNNEFGFDYLRDNMCGSVDELVQREHYFAIVDEVDSVLIDEARTPLIISGPVSKSTHQYDQMNPFVKKIVDRQRKYITELLDKAEKELAEDPKSYEGFRLLFLVKRGAPKNKRLIKLLNQEGMQRNISKVESDFIRDKRIHELDEELYFSIDEKSNSIDLSDMGREYISPNDPNYFVLPEFGAIMADIENDTSLDEMSRLQAKEKFQVEYSEKSERLHNISQLLKAYMLFEKDNEYVVDNGEIKIVDEFTGRIMDGRRYSDGLHQAIEAKEGVKIERETQTMATITLQNYFRMYERLAGMTGTAETESVEFYEIYKLDTFVIPTNKPIARKDHNDLIFKTKRERYNAVVERIVELHGTGQPVLIGTTSVEESELLSRMLKRTGIPHNVLNAKHHDREAEIVANAGQQGAVTISTSMAGRGTDIKLGANVKNMGLNVIGTGRHESRRIDRQLRGRSGRQGDPGASQIYLSLEDELMRLFNSDRIASVMDRLGAKEGEVITHPLITRQIEAAQKRVEMQNYAIRKRLLEYDDVMNTQRKVIYERRMQALKNTNLDELISGIMEQFIVATIENFSSGGHGEPSDWMLDEIFNKLGEVLLIDLKLKDELMDFSYDEFIDRIIEEAKHILSLKHKLVGRERFEEFERFVVLSVTDDYWKNHLYEMDALRENSQMEAMGKQQDPLVIYKSSAFTMFTKLLDSMDEQILRLIWHVEIESSNSQYEAQDVSQLETVHEQVSGYASGDSDIQKAGRKSRVQTIVREEPKVGRNDACPCGSGKKYKQCHGK